MNIAVNTRLLLKDRLEGIGWFTQETMKRITSAHPGHRFLFLFDRPFAPEFIFGGNITPLVIPPPARHPLLWYAWFEYRLPRFLKGYKADLYVGPDGYMPLHLEIPSLVTIHDINFHHRPGDLPLASRIYYNRFFPRFARRATRIATVSRFSKTDLVNSYGLNPDKIDVVYNGVNEIFSPQQPAESSANRDRLTGGVPYFVFVGSMHPRKNLTGLLKGFDRFRSAFDSGFRLAIVGERMFMTREIANTYRRMQHREDVLFTGRLSPADLKDVLGASEGLTFLPHFEGFGIPLLEAMRCEVPILASNASSLPEIAADAAIYANPDDPDDIARGMMLLAKDKGLRSRLIQSARMRSAEFSWDKTSGLLWDSLCRVIESC